MPGTAPRPRRPAPAAAAALALLALAAAFAPPGLGAGAPRVDCDPACSVLVLPAANDAALAVSPLDPLHLVLAARDYRLGAAAACGGAQVWAAVAVSRDGGATWSDALLPGHPGAALAPLSVHPCLRDPVVAFHPDGQVLLAAHGFGRLDPAPGAPGTPAGLAGAWAAASADGGASWPLAVPLGFDAGGALGYGQGGLGVDPTHGVAYHVWDAAPGMLFSRTPEGTAWTPGAPLLDTQNLAVHRGPGVQVAVSNQNIVFALWTTDAHGPGDLKATHSQDFGITWEAPLQIARVQPIAAPGVPHPLPTLPSMAIDLRLAFGGGTMYVVWQDQRFGSPDILVSRSRDGGHVFELALRVTDDAPGPAAQYFPAVAVGPQGEVHAAWYDQRAAPGSGMVDVYYARSDDFGQTWSPNLRVTPASFDPGRSLDEAGQPFLGERVALAVGGDGVAHVAWTDTTGGAAHVRAARILPG